MERLRFRVFRVRIQGFTRTKDPPSALATYCCKGNLERRMVVLRSSVFG